jgi:hypothetical protein
MGKVHLAAHDSPRYIWPRYIWPRYIWPQVHLAAGTFGRRYIWHKNVNPCWYIWPQVHLAANFSLFDNLLISFNKQIYKYIFYKIQIRCSDRITLDLFDLCLWLSSDIRRNNKYNRNNSNIVYSDISGLLHLFLTFLTRLFLTNQVPIPPIKKRPPVL